MKHRITHSLVAASLALGLSALISVPVQAQSSGLTRAQVKMDRDTFLATMRWDDSAGAWVLKDDMTMPEGVASRSEINAMRDKFLSMHTWNESESKWVPVKGTPRDMSKLTREQVKAETAAFLKMYMFNPFGSTWELKTR